MCHDIRVLRNRYFNSVRPTKINEQLTNFPYNGVMFNNKEKK